MQIIVTTIQISNNWNGTRACVESPNKIGNFTEWKIALFRCRVKSSSFVLAGNYCEKITKLKEFHSDNKSLRFF